MGGNAFCLGESVLLSRYEKNIHRKEEEKKKGREGRRGKRQCQEAETVLTLAILMSP